MNKIKSVSSDDLMYEINWNTLQNLRDNVDKWIEKFGADAKISISAYEDYGDVTAHFHIRYSREETDAEVELRKIQDYQQHLAEVSEYERLKAKLGK